MTSKERRSYDGIWFHLEAQAEAPLFPLCTPEAQTTVNNFIFSWRGSPGSDVSLGNNGGKRLGRHVLQMLE